MGCCYTLLAAREIWKYGNMGHFIKLWAKYYFEVLVKKRVYLCIINSKESQRDGM